MPIVEAIKQWTVFKGCTEYADLYYQYQEVRIHIYQVSTGEDVTPQAERGAPPALLPLPVPIDSLKRSLPSQFLAL